LSKKVRTKLAVLKGEVHRMVAFVDDVVAIDTNARTEEKVVPSARTIVIIQAEGESGAVIHCEVGAIWPDGVEERVVNDDLVVDGSGRLYSVFDVPLRSDDADSPSSRPRGLSARKAKKRG